MIANSPGLSDWDSFYVIVGSAAAALIGLQFVVMTLVAERPPVGAAVAGAAFSTPTIVHFAGALLVAALLRAPWLTITFPAVLWGLVGLAGVVYMFLIVWRIRSQSVYGPGVEDWLCHVALPFIAYVLLALSAFAAPAHTRPALFVVGAATLLLLFVGIHNAWDAVAYNVFVLNAKQPPPRSDEDRSADG
jgi:hypothetical protein